MRYRSVGRLGWDVSELGYGVRGAGSGSGDLAARSHETAPGCLDLAVDLGCTFFDTAWAHDRGAGERMLGDLLRRHPDRRLYVATEVPPLNRRRLSRPGDALDDVFPPDHVREYVHRSLENLGTDHIDLLQFHVWEDRWSDDERWQQVIRDLRAEGVIEGFGINAGPWEPENCLRAIDTGLVDVVQVAYNIFEQAPEDELFERALLDDIGIIVRVPFDGGSLAGGPSAAPCSPRTAGRRAASGPGGRGRRTGASSG
ncbi:aldo/keto reductase [Streptomyces sp. CNQ085]|uniref:aldo/keto reductase n=1 Tax=Streptomyces sp. CNQ085 TaxID=2886944 RepID=UPI001F50CA04|nr:aldo/keto reductase [Streptomyces sp. CNQ085]MCI0383090.1 aldo/keto reductase [Streptomyces sp. CNQ085]